MVLAPAAAAAAALAALLLPAAAVAATATAAPYPSVEVAPGVFLPFMSDGIILDSNGTHKEVTGLELFFSLGGRGVDTAWSYFNQPAIGKAVRQQKSYPRSVPVA